MCPRIGLLKIECAFFIIAPNENSGRSQSELSFHNGSVFDVLDIGV